MQWLNGAGLDTMERLLLTRLERRVGRPVLLQGGLIHCRDVQAVVNALVNQ